MILVHFFIKKSNHNKHVDNNIVISLSRRLAVSQSRNEEYFMYLVMTFPIIVLNCI